MVERGGDRRSAGLGGGIDRRRQLCRCGDSEAVLLSQGLGTSEDLSVSRDEPVRPVIDARCKVTQVGGVCDAALACGLGCELQRLSQFAGQPSNLVCRGFGKTW